MPEIELERQARIQRNRQVLCELGLEHAGQRLMARPPRKRKAAKQQQVSQQQQEQQPLQPARKSRRLQGDTPEVDVLGARFVPVPDRRPARLSVSCPCDCWCKQQPARTQPHVVWLLTRAGAGTASWTSMSSPSAAEAAAEVGQQHSSSTKTSSTAAGMGGGWTQLRWRRCCSGSRTTLTTCTTLTGACAFVVFHKLLAL